MSVPPKTLGIEQRLAALETTVKQNTDAIRAILTIIHPHPDHPTEPLTVDPQLQWLHDLVMRWIETYGRIEKPT